MSRETMLRATYWVATFLFCAGLAWSAVQYLTEAPKMQETMISHLGYPAYFPKLLAVFKLAGVAMLLTGVVPTLKEWAYAGFTFDLLGAAASHGAVGDSLLVAAVPLAFLLLLGTSYFLWKRLPQKEARLVPGSAKPVTLRSRTVTGH